MILETNCKIYNDYDTLYLGQTIQFATQRYFNVTFDIPYSQRDIIALESKLIQLPKIVSNINL